MPEGGGVLREILALFTIEARTEELDRAEKRISSFREKLFSIVNVAAEAFAVGAIKEFVQSQVEVVTELERTATRLGLTTEQVEKYNLAAGLSGVSNEAMSTGLRFLSRNIGEAVSKGGSAAEAFQKLHVVLQEGGKTRGTNEVLEDLADRFQKIEDPAKRTQLAMQLFGRQGTELIPILSKGSAAFKEAEESMKALGGPTSAATIESAKKVEESEAKLSFAWGRLKVILAEQLFPVFEKLVTWGTKITASVLDLASHTHILGEAMAILGGFATYKLISGLTALAKTYGLVKDTLLETSAAFWSFAWPVLLVVGLGLAFDELWVMMNGGRSVIGETLDALFGFGTAADTAETLNAAWEDSVQVLKDIAAIVAGTVIPNIVTLWELLRGIATTIYDIVTAKWGDIGKDLVAAGGRIADAWAAGDKTVGDAEDDLGGKNGTALGRLRDRRAADGQFGPSTGPGRADVGAIDFTGATDAPFWQYGKMAGPGQVDVGKISFGQGIGHVPEQHGLRAAAGHGTTIYQTNHNTSNVHTADKPKPVADAVAKAQTDAMDKSNGKLALTKP
jgi:hypothetical protein